MGSCCGCCSAQKNKLDRDNSLRSAQNLTHTRTGKLVNKRVKYAFLTRPQLLQLRDHLIVSDPHFDEVFFKPMTTFSQITENLYLTGMGGICVNNIRKHDIKCLINVTYELPKYMVGGIDSYRIPVEDSYSDDLFPYFKDICNLIDENTKNDRKTVVYCMAGVSRSPTLVIAYMMTYRKMTLKEAFSYVETKRSIILPNRHFLRQLIEYEKQLYKKTFVNMIQIDSNNGTKTSVPDFTLKRYLNTTGTGTEPDQAQHHPESLDMILSLKYKDLDFK